MGPGRLLTKPELLQTLVDSLLRFFIPMLAARNLGRDEHLVPRDAAFPQRLSDLVTPYYQSAASLLQCTAESREGAPVPHYNTFALNLYACTQP